jgi:hypothetical protein
VKVGTRDILWLSLVLLAAWGWYVHSWSMCPELPKLETQYREAQQKTEHHAKQIDEGITRLQGPVDEMKQRIKERRASIVHLRSEKRQLEQLEAEFYESGPVRKD